ncbi:AAA family ATPase [Streptomyces sp. SID8359]|uniref:AAA family ATPase n=1 Tax=unclassified Streptomyces TaxID=2593676 RepID=UPI0004908968|nr:MULTISPECIES: AAA family ATPase [unclassified Streptomyces]MYT92809.1 AAA family ATPase [Streptomyces sp. SID8359]
MTTELVPEVPRAPGPYELAPPAAELIPRPAEVDSPLAEVPYDPSEVAGVFDVYVLPIGPVIGFDDVGTAAEAELTAAALQRFGGQPVPALPVPEEPGGADGGGRRALRSLGEVDEELARWAGEREVRAVRPSALLWFGHGVQGAMGPTLLVPGAGERTGNARMTPDLFAHYIFTEQQKRDTEEGHWAIVVIEACNSANFAEDVQRRFTGSSSPSACSLLLVATGKPNAQGYLGTFRGALEEWIQQKTVRDEVFTLRDLQDHFQDCGHHAELLGRQASLDLKLRLRDRVPLPGVTTVAEQLRLQRDFDGSPTTPRTSPLSDTDSGFLEPAPEFTGRATDLALISAWCADPDAPPLLAVTGPPGTGKSALLGEFLRRLREGVGDALGGIRVAAVLRLTGSTADDVVRQLADALGTVPPKAAAPGPPGGQDACPAKPPADEHNYPAEPPVDEDRCLAQPPADERGHPAKPLGEDDSCPAKPLGEDTADPRADDLLERVRGRLSALSAATAPDHRTLVVADALDEARDPIEAASLLRDLTDIPGVRLLIGTRTSAYGAGAPGDEGELSTVLGSTTGHARIHPLAPDPEGAADHAARHVRRILRKQPTHDPGWWETVAHTVRKAVHQHVRDGAWQFLQVTLMIQELEQRPEVLIPGTAGRVALEHLLHRDGTGLFRSAVTRLTDAVPTAGPFLRALAFGQGRGLPRAEGIWAHAAAGIAGPGVSVGDRELSLFLSRAAAYVLLDGEDRRSVYRLAHRTYTEQLRADSTDEQRLGMLTALLDLAAAQAGAGQPLSPHLASRLAQYAADCSTEGWRELALRPAVLDRLPPTALASMALATARLGGGTTSADLPIHVLGTVVSAHLIEESLPADRPGLRQLGGLRATGRWHPAGTDAAWEVCWGRLRPVPLHLQLGGADGMVSALNALPSAPWLVTGSLDGTVLVWEPWRAHRPALVLRGRTSPVSALAAQGDREQAGDEGPGLLAVAHDDGTVQLWDTGSLHPEPRTVATAQVIRVITALPDGTGRFAVAGDDGHLALVGPDGRQPRPARAVVSGEVVGLAPVARPGGRQWLAAAHRSGELALWDVTGETPSELTTVSTRRVLTALTALKDGTDGDEEGTVRLVTAAKDGRVEFWRMGCRDDGAVLILADGEVPPDVPGAPQDVDPVLAALPVSGGGEAAVLGDDGGLRLLTPGAGPGRPVYVAGPIGADALTVLRGPSGGHVIATAAVRDPRVCFWAPAADASEAAVRERDWNTFDGMRRHLLADGTEVLVFMGKADGAPVKVLRASDGEELARGVPPDHLLMANATEEEATDDHVPAPVHAFHPRRVQGWRQLLGEEHKGLWASAGREGVIGLWRHDPSGSWQLMHRIRLGSRCRLLTALSGGRLAAATKDGVLVLAIGAIGTAVPGTGSRRKEEAGG